MAIVVKNTFLNVEQQGCVAKRRSSLPQSFKPSEFAEQPHSSTASTLKPSVFAEKPHSSTASTDSVSRNDSMLSDVSSADIPDSRAGQQSRAGAKLTWEPSMRFKFDFAKVIKRSIKLLCSSELIANVQKSESSHECLLTVQMSAVGALQKEQVQTLVQETLLDGAVPSKSIYIIGFRGTSPFISTEFGLDLKYGAMENAKTACWHFFKKGSCRHGDHCKKQHTIWEMPARVRIEAAPSESVGFSFCSDMKKEM